MKLRLKTFRCGDPPHRGEGLRIAVTRRPPRGVARQDWHRHFDVWFPILAPSEALRRRWKSDNFGFGEYCLRYERELLGRAESRQAVELLAALAARTPISIGCYCEDESLCHRSHLRKLIEGMAKRWPPGQVAVFRSRTTR